MKLSNIFYNLAYLSLGATSLGTMLAILVEPLLGAKFIMYGITSCSVTSVIGAHFDKGEKEWKNHIWVIINIQYLQSLVL